MTRGYYRSSKAWYTGGEEVVFGHYSPEGGTTGEMKVKWVKLQDYTAPKLEVFNDSWKVLYAFPDVIKSMAEVDSQNITEEQFVAILDSLGFKDLTPYEAPYKGSV